MSGEILNFYTDCAPSYVINSKLFADRIEFSYLDNKSIAGSQSSSSSPRSLCTIELNDQKTSLLIGESSFKFHLVKGGSNNVSHFIIGLNEQLSSSSLYKYTIGASTSSPDLLASFTSHIVLLDSFQLKVGQDPLKLLLSDAAEKTRVNKTTTTYLLIVTKCGRLHLYEEQDLSGASHRVCLLQQSQLKDCVRFGENLVYASESGVYAIKLNDLRSKKSSSSSSTLKSNLVKCNIQAVKFQIDKNVLFVVAKSGRRYELDPTKTETNTEPELLTGKDLVRQSITNLTQKAAQIVNMQLKLDIINTTLKQINLIKSVASHRDMIQVQTKFLDNSLQVELVNNSLTLQDPAQSYNLIVVLNTGGSSGYQTSRQVGLTARRPNTRQTIDMHLRQQNESYSCRLSVFLVFDCHCFVKESIKSMNHQSELSLSDEELYSELRDLVVCVHSSALSLTSFLTDERRRSIESDRTSVLYKLLAEYCAKERLDTRVWTKIEVNGLDKSHAESLSNTRQLATSKLVFGDLNMTLSEQPGDKFKLSVSIDSTGVNPAAVFKSVCFMNEIKHRFLIRQVLTPLMNKHSTDEELKRVLAGNKSSLIEKLSQRLRELSAKRDLSNKRTDDESISMDYETAGVVNHRDHESSNFYSIQNLHRLIDLYLTLRASFSIHV